MNSLDCDQVAEFVVRYRTANSSRKVLSIQLVVASKLVTLICNWPTAPKRIVAGSVANIDLSKDVALVDSAANRTRFRVLRTDPQAW